MTHLVANGHADITRSVMATMADITRSVMATMDFRHESSFRLQTIVADS